METGMTIYIEGGFRENRSYCALLAGLCPGTEIVLSDMTEATSFGAALLALAALTDKPLKQIKDKYQIETEPVEKITFTGLTEYQNKFYQLLG